MPGRSKGPYLLGFFSAGVTPKRFWGLNTGDFFRCWGAKNTTRVFRCLHHLCFFFKKGRISNLILTCVQARCVLCMICIHRGQKLLNVSPGVVLLCGGFHVMGLVGRVLLAISVVLVVYRRGGPPPPPPPPHPTHTKTKKKKKKTR